MTPCHTLPMSLSYRSSLTENAVLLQGRTRKRRLIPVELRKSTCRHAHVRKIRTTKEPSSHSRNHERDAPRKAWI